MTSTIRCDLCANEVKVPDDRPTDFVVCAPCQRLALGPAPSPADMPQHREPPAPLLDRPEPGQPVDHAQLADQCAQHAEHWLARLHDHPSSLAAHRSRDFLALGQLHARIALAVATRLAAQQPRRPARSGGLVAQNVDEDGIPEFYERERL